MPFFRQNAENKSGLSKRAVIAFASATLAAVFGVSIGVPLMQRSRIRAKEAVLQANLALLREAVGAYRAKTLSWPTRAADLVTAGLMSELPLDPFTGRSDTWQISEPSAIRSGSDQMGLNGKPYSRW